MWRDHPFSQRSRITEKTVKVEVGGNRERAGWTKFEKGGGGAIKGVFIKKGEVRTDLPTM